METNEEVITPKLEKQEHTPSSSSDGTTQTLPQQPSQPQQHSGETDKEPSPEGEKPKVPAEASEPQDSKESDQPTSREEKTSETSPEASPEESSSPSSLSTITPTSLPPSSSLTNDAPQSEAAVPPASHETSETSTNTKPKRKPKIKSGGHDAQGDRNTMEDTHVHFDDLHKEFPDHKHLDRSIYYSFYGVYDGHGGKQTAELAQLIVHKNIMNSPLFKNGEYEGAIKEAFEQSDKEILEKASQEQWSTNGCTVASCLIVDNEVFLANLGDAELVAGQIGEGGNLIGVQLTEKHKASGDKEKERIKKLGGVVIYGRIFGTLAVSRSFGDAEFKIPKTGANFVSSEPYLTKFELVPEVHQFLVIACDGLWDVMKYQEAVDIVKEEVTKGKTPREISEALVKEALRKGTQDNVTVIVVLFDWS